MQKPVKQNGHPPLKELVTEASRSLARLDAGRLEELALSCKALNRNMARLDTKARTALALEAGDSTRELAIFARVLEATRANLHVMKRLRELRTDCVEYSKPVERKWTQTGSNYGDN